MRSESPLSKDTPVPLTAKTGCQPF